MEKLDSTSLLSPFRENPSLDNSKTLLDAGLIEIADKFPPKELNAPLIDENLAFPLLFSNVKEIASIKEVDCLWVGHFDLTNFLGIPGDFSSTIYLDAINEIVFAANTYKKSLGIMVNNKQELKTYSKLGFNMIAVGTEMNILSRSISQILK